MYKFIYSKLVNGIKSFKIDFKNSRLLVLGLTYKKNVSDIRNSYAINVVKLLKKRFRIIDVYDPLLKNKKLKDIKIMENIKIANYDLVIKDICEDVSWACKDAHYIVDLVINLVNHDIFKSIISKIKKSKKKYLELF